MYKLVVKSIEKEKWENEKRIYNLVESSRDVIYFYELKPERKFKYLSPSIEALLGAGLVTKCYENPDIIFSLIHPMKKKFK